MIVPFFAGYLSAPLIVTLDCITHEFQFMISGQRRLSDANDLQMGMDTAAFNPIPRPKGWRLAYRSRGHLEIVDRAPAGAARVARTAAYFPGGR
jgi:hypothetical protein